MSDVPVGLSAPPAGYADWLADQGWGAKVVERLAHDLRTVFPDMKGFSPGNLKYMRAFAEAWPDAEFMQQAVAQLPWGHNLVLLERSGTAVTNFEARLPKPQEHSSRMREECVTR